MRFYFNTGVRPENRGGFGLMPGQVWHGGTMQIPFECDDVPAGATFKFACDDPNAGAGLIVREINNSTLMSKYAFFAL